VTVHVIAQCLAQLTTRCLRCANASDPYAMQRLGPMMAQVLSDSP
jgi:hypothetical protein